MLEWIKGVSAYHIFLSMEHSTNQNLRFFKDGRGFGILMLSGEPPAGLSFLQPKRSYAANRNPCISTLIFGISTSQLHKILFALRDENHFGQCFLSLLLSLK